MSKRIPIENLQDRMVHDVQDRMDRDVSQYDRIVRPHEIQALTGLSTRTIDRLEADGQFPKRLQLSTKAVGWKLSSINIWLRTRTR
jgi:prophage regulatory protein